MRLWRRGISLVCICFLILSFNIREVNAYRKDIDNYEIEKFMDEFFNKEMEEYNVPGASVVVVSNGKEIFKKGYGYTNLESRIQVNPNESTFPTASVSKLFTAIAIMQLYEKGNLDLNENVEKYIYPYKIGNPYDTTITCTNLLTHSSGLDEQSEINVGTENINDLKSQEYYFDNHRLKVVTNPNTISRYSNIGYNLLGYIVERVSGCSYEDYITKNILEPLSMNDSTVRIGDSNLSTGYEFDQGKNVNTSLSYQYTSGSSGVITTASDMERFMLAILNNGELNGVRILKETTMQEMKNKQFANDNIFPGMGYGFIRSDRNGKSILKHEGALPGFTSSMFLIEDENIGIYVTTNSLSPLPFNIEDEFLNKFYSTNNYEWEGISGEKNKDYSIYEGTYRSYDGISKNTIMKIGILFDQSLDLKIKDNKDGTLTLKEYTNAKEENITRLKEVENGVFVREDGKGKFVFKENDNKVVYAFNDISHNSYEKIKPYEGRCINILVIIITLLIYISIIIRFIFRRLKEKFNNKVVSGKISKYRFLERVNFSIASFNILGFIGSITTALYMVLKNNYSIRYLIYTFLVMIIISVILTCLESVMNIKNLFNTTRDSIFKVGAFIILNILNLNFIWILSYFNFIGIKIQ